MAISKWKRTELEQYRLRDSYNNLHSLLQNLRMKELKGSALEDMKMLENVVSELETLLMRSMR